MSSVEYTLALVCLKASTVCYLSVILLNRMQKAHWLPTHKWITTHKWFSNTQNNRSECEFCMKMKTHFGTNGFVLFAQSTFSVSLSFSIITTSTALFCSFLAAIFFDSATEFVVRTLCDGIDVELNLSCCSGSFSHCLTIN